MRHRAPRPFADLWRRPRARVLAPLAALLLLAGGGYAVIATGPDGPSTPTAEPATSPSPTEAAPSRPSTDPTTRPAPSSRKPESGSSPSTTPSRTPSSPTTTDASPSATGASELLRGLASGSRAPTGEATTSRTPASRSGTEDVTAPVTSLGERFPVPDAAVFTVSADEPSTFSCSLDGAAFSPCPSTVTYADLDPGWHTFAVRATDAAGNVDPSPARTRWRSTPADSAGGVGD